MLAFNLELIGDRMTQLVIFTRALSAFALAALSFAVGAADMPPLPAGLSAPAKPVHLPQFTLATPAGGKVNADEFKGKVLIARFWATW
jgi:hypothetical protein